MSRLISVSYEGKPCYDILLEQDFQMLPSQIAKLSDSFAKKVCIVTDSNLADLYLKELESILSNSFAKVISFCFPAGEEHKNLNTIQKLYETLITEHFERRGVLIAFGGGVTGDLTGFAAATYLRGIDFIQIPTSLLSQVDSSIGGKTGVDFSKYKNMVGAFYQPKFVYMNLSLLKTLPKEQFISGMGEIIKHGLIKSSEYFNWLKEHADAIQNLQPDILEEMIYRSCRIKQDVVERDPKEKGERALLNFGHTIGHAIERLSDFQLFHGQCVALGIAAACQMSRDLGQISDEECNDILSVLTCFGLPISICHLSAKDILAVSKSDKKMTAGKIKFILLESVGNAYSNTDITDEQIMSGISYILERSDSRREEEQADAAGF